MKAPTILSKIKYLSIATLFTASFQTHADNPLIYDVGMADPHIKIFNDKAYLYATRDAEKYAQGFVMPDWKIYSSEDLINWTLDTTITTEETYMGESNDAWAPDVATKNGKFYFYFSNRNIDTGVMVGPSPIGPFKDALGKPLLAKDLTPIKEYDPTVLIDDDENETPYMIFGHMISNNPDFYYAIAKLNDDMISLAEHPKEIIIHETLGLEPNILGANDKPTLHKHNGIYYLSAGSHYATATNVYGPYTKRGNSGNHTYGLRAQAHGNYFEWNNQWFHVWCHFHLGKEVGRYRESKMSYLHYKDNGEMVTDTEYLDDHYKTGVGQYFATWDRIEAEWYMGLEKGEKRENPLGGFEIQNIQDGAFVHFPNIHNGEDKTSIQLFASSVNGSSVEIRRNSPTGELLGKGQIQKTSSWKSYKTNSIEISQLTNLEDIYIVFTGKDEDLAHLDWIKFD